MEYKLSKKQRQQILFRSKGNISAMCSLTSSLAYNILLTPLLRDKCMKAYLELSEALKIFNREIDWKEKI